VTTDGRVRLVSGYARAGGDAGPASWAMRVKGQARLGWASWADRCRLGHRAEQAWLLRGFPLPFPFSICFSSSLFLNSNLF